MPQSLSPEKKYRFPWQHGNRFQLLVDGPTFFSAMLADIQAAQHYILLEMYLVNPGSVSQRFFQAFCQAAERGVQVYLLLDDYGARGITSYTRQQLINCGVHLCFYNPVQLNRHGLLVFRDHRKLMVVDGKTAYVGGTGLVDEFDSLNYPEKNWRENMVKIEGCNVIQWQSLFLDNWSKWSEVSIDLITPELGDFQQQGRVTITQGPRFLEIKRSFINHVRHAKHKVWLCTAYFVPSRKLRSALRRAALRGIDVRILIPGDITDHPMARYIAQKYYARLLRDGVKIFEYQPRFMHAKIVLCDNWVSTGSCNIDSWNLRWNLDANQEIVDQEFAAEVIGMFEDDFTNSHEVTLDEWKKRPLYRRIAIWFWSSYARFGMLLLTRLRILRNWKQLRKAASKQSHEGK